MRLLAIAAALGSMVGAAAAQDYPTRPAKVPAMARVFGYPKYWDRGLGKFIRGGKKSVGLGLRKGLELHVVPKHVRTCALATVTGATDRIRTTRNKDNEDAF